MRKNRKLGQTGPFIVIIVAVFSMLLATKLLAVVAEQDDIIDVKIIHTNDLHAQIDEFAKVAAYIKGEREAASHSLYLDAGDIFSGNPVVDLQHGQPMVDLLNHIGVDAMTMGNHDFDYGQNETVKRIREAKFPWLSANIKVSQDTLVAFPQPEPYRIFEINGVKIGVLGLTEAPPSTPPANIAGISFDNPIKTAKHYQFLAKKTDILIALTHIGFKKDCQLAKEVDFFDLIIGSHSHTTLSEPVIVNGTPIVQTGSNATHIGNVTLAYNHRTGEVNLVESHLQRISDLTKMDAVIQEQIERYNLAIEELLLEEIGYTETGLNKSGKADTSLGNFLTDAMLHFTGAEVAFINNGGIRDNIPVGPITLNHVHTIEPFANKLIAYEMTGKALKDVIAFSYQRRNSVDLQTAGLHYTILTDHTGQYVNVELAINGHEVVDDQTYKVVVDDYIGTGGSGYHFDGVVLDTLSGTMREAMIAYAKYLTEMGLLINYQPNHRIEIEVLEDMPAKVESIR
ncbi:bifunctional metallophosphatase/5'-nucleotidase [Amphibacillus sediminis]|uniref:bifunctional metallophosphatase/5'-nucleotidase n=1 Tax=Amphibacillus sediminis TaxID=360185 RepID=UPI00082C3BCA|nr:bifunctional UDP-sugar hydrolase/5'-nucleotidase [Amphibacillus sediminis]